MKMKEKQAKGKIVAVFLCGLLLGMLVMGGILCLLRNHRETEAQVFETTTETVDTVEEQSETAETVEEQPETAGTVEEQTEAVDAAETEGDESASKECEPETETVSEITEDTDAAGGADSTAAVTADTWSAEAVYVGGDEVAYRGKLYRAKWWTQGETPGQADVWEDTLIAVGMTVEAASENAALEKSASEKAAKVTGSVPFMEAGKRSDFKVVGYFPSWANDTSKIRYDVLTHINYAFAIPTAEGGLRPLDNEKLARQLISEAHKNGVKVFIAVGGWSYNDVPLESTFVSATATKEKRDAFVNAIMELCDSYGFDGVDMDWEHPRVDGGTYKQYEELITELAKRLHAKGKQLSSAVLSGATADGNIYYDAAAHTDQVLEAVDWINVMAYDGGDGERHSSYDFAVNCGTYWSSTRGMPKEKVVLGVPFYARPSWASYGNILAQIPDAWKYDHTSYNGMEVWYNGVDTMEKKTTYALKNLGGIMIWEVSQDSADDHSLQMTIGKTVKEFKK